jgi:hypothetical protein
VVDALCNGFDPITNHWQNRAGIAVPILILNLVIFALSGFLGWKLMKTYDQEWLKKIGEDRKALKTYKVSGFYEYSRSRNSHQQGGGHIFIAAATCSLLDLRSFRAGSHDSIQAGAYRIVKEPKSLPGHLYISFTANCSMDYDCRSHSLPIRQLSLNRCRREIKLRMSSIEP